jgi:hypothetical protein
MGNPRSPSIVVYLLAAGTIYLGMVATMRASAPIPTFVTIAALSDANVGIKGTLANL